MSFRAPAQAVWRRFESVSPSCESLTAELSFHQDAKKGTGPICRNGPEGATQKLDLSPFSLAPSGLAEPTATTRAVLEPAPVAPFAALDPEDWAVPSRAAEVADDQWIPAVDASLGDWEPGWENPLESPFAA